MNTTKGKIVHFFCIQEDNKYDSKVTYLCIILHSNRFEWLDFYLMWFVLGYCKFHAKRDSQ